MKIRMAGSVTILEAGGRLSHAQPDLELFNSYLDMFQRSAVDNDVVINCAGIHLLGTDGLRALVRAQQAIAGTGKTLKLCCLRLEAVPHHVGATLRIAFPTIYNTEEEAVRSNSYTA